MKLVTVGCVVLCAMSALTTPGQERAVRKELETTLKAITSAIQRKNATAYEKYLAPDFTSTEANGRVHSRAEVLQEWTGMMQAFKDFKWTRHISSLKQVGSVWVTVTESHLSAKVPGRDSKLHAFSFDATSQDRWERIGGHWQDHGAKVLKSVAKMDGKPVPMR